jgi:hypothetical protein
LILPGTAAGKKAAEQKDWADLILFQNRFAYIN